MKKLFLVALAAVGLASCVQNEELAVAGSTTAIAFGDSFVYNATKADPTTTTATIDNFDVWAFMDEVGGTVLTDEDVTKVNDVWGYQNLQYWAPNHTYYFAALSPIGGHWTATPATATADAVLGLGKVAFTNADGTEDLLYAKKSVETPDTMSELAAQGMDAVEMQFQHLLSKVKFTFQNGFTTDNMKVVVKNVRMSAPKSATIDLAVADYSKGWVLGTEAIELAFGNAAGEQLAAGASASTVDTRLTIPASSAYEYTVTFNVEVYSGSVLAFSETDKQATIKGYELAMGKAYNFTAVINADSFGLQPIEFTATVDEWAPETEQGSEWFGPSVATRTELQAAIDEAPVGKTTTIYLSEDIDLSATRANESYITRVENGSNIVIDGLGHKLNGQIRIKGQSVWGNETTIIRNIDFVSEAEGMEFIWSNDTANGSYWRYANNVTVENCTFTANGAAVKTAVAVKFQQARNITVKNCEGTNLHSLCQFQSNDTAIVLEGLKAVNCKNGISLGTTKKVTINGLEIDAQEYGLRLDGHSLQSGTRCSLNVANATITAMQPIIARKVTVGYDLTLGENVVLNSSELYHVIFTTTSDDVRPYVAPAEGKYTFSSVANYNVFPVAEDAVLSVDNTADVKAALAQGNDVVLTQNIAVAKADTGTNGYGVTGIDVLNGQTIDGNGKSISVNAWGTWDSAINTTGGLIKNLYVTGGMRGIFINHNSKHSEKVVLENVVINGTVYTVSCDQGTYQGLEATNCTFNGWTSYAETIGAVKFVGCNFGKGQGYAFCQPYAATEFVNCAFAAGYEMNPVAAVTFENCTIGGVALTAENLATLVIGNHANASVK